jgi:hypothetical protein
MNSYNENIKIEVILTDRETNLSVKAETTTKIIKEMHDKHNIWGIDLIFNQLYKELEKQKK